MPAEPPAALSGTPAGMPVQVTQPMFTVDPASDRPVAVARPMFVVEPQPPARAGWKRTVEPNGAAAAALVPATPSAPRGLVDLSRGAHSGLPTQMAWDAVDELRPPSTPSTVPPSPLGIAPPPLTTPPFSRTGAGGGGSGAAAPLLAQPSPRRAAGLAAFAAAAGAASSVSGGSSTTTTTGSGSGGGVAYPVPPEIAAAAATVASISHTALATAASTAALRPPNARVSTSGPSTARAPRGRSQRTSSGASSAAASDDEEGDWSWHDVATGRRVGSSNGSGRPRAATPPGTDARSEALDDDMFFGRVHASAPWPLRRRAGRDAESEPVAANNNGNSDDDGDGDDQLPDPLDDGRPIRFLRPSVYQSPNLGGITVTKP